MAKLSFAVLANIALCGMGRRARVGDLLADRAHGGPMAGMSQLEVASSEKILPAAAAYAFQQPMYAPRQHMLMRRGRPLYATRPGFVDTEAPSLRYFDYEDDLDDGEESGVGQDLEYQQAMPAQGWKQQAFKPWQVSGSDFDDEEEFAEFDEGEFDNWLQETRNNKQKFGQWMQEVAPARGRAKANPTPQQATGALDDEVAFDDDEDDTFQQDVALKRGRARAGPRPWGAAALNDDEAFTEDEDYDLDEDVLPKLGRTKKGPKPGRASAALDDEEALELDDDERLEQAFALMRGPKPNLRPSRASAAIDDEEAFEEGDDAKLEQALALLRGRNTASPKPLRASVAIGEEEDFDEGEGYVFSPNVAPALGRKKVGPRPRKALSDFEGEMGFDDDEDFAWEEGIAPRWGRKKANPKPVPASADIDDEEDFGEGQGYLLSPKVAPTQGGKNTSPKPKQASGDFDEGDVDEVEDSAWKQGMAPTQGRKKTGPKPWQASGDVDDDEDFDAADDYSWKRDIVPKRGRKKPSPSLQSRDVDDDFDDDFDEDFDEDGGTWEDFVSEVPRAFAARGLTDMDEGVGKVISMNSILEVKEYIPVPAEWLPKLKEGSIQLHCMEGWDEVYTARLAASPRAKVAFKAMNMESPAAQRVLALMDRMRSVRGSKAASTGKGLLSGNVLSYFEMKQVGEVTFFLMEAQEQNLDQMLNLVSLGKKSNEKIAGNLHIPLPEVLGYLVDILLGLRALEKEGMVHAALSPENIVLRQPLLMRRKRAVISGLSSVCLVDGDKTIGCGSLADTQVQFDSAPLFQPPQVVDGAPTGFADHAWSAGVLLGQLMFGYNVVELAVANNYGKRTPPSDLNFKGRQKIREVVANGFSIQKDPNFAALDPDLQLLMAGMLLPDEERRLTTDQALALARKIARERDIKLPCRRKAAELSKKW